MLAKNKPLQLGKSEYIYIGKDIAIVSYGSMMDTASDIYSKLIKNGYEPTIINARFASPIDEDMADDLANNYKYIFTLEDNIYSGGFGCLLDQKLSIHNKNYIIKNYAFKDAYIEHGKKDLLLKRYGLDAESIFNDIMDILKG